MKSETPLSTRLAKSLLPPDYYEPVTMTWASLPGAISAKQQQEHWKLYLGYLEALKRIDGRVPRSEKPLKGIVDSEYRGLKEAESYVIGGSLLHGMYFEQFLLKSRRQGETRIEGQISKIWGSQGEWWKDFRACAMNARGWAVLAVCEIDPNDLRIFLLDSHNMGSMFGYSPLVVLDAYEHAYWLDFGVEKGDHFDNLIKYLDWTKIDERFMQLLTSWPP